LGSESDVEPRRLALGRARDVVPVAEWAAWRSFPLLLLLDNSHVDLERAA